MSEYLNIACISSDNNFLTSSLSNQCQLKKQLVKLGGANRAMYEMNFEHFHISQETDHTKPNLSVNVHSVSFVEIKSLH